MNQEPIDSERTNLASPEKKWKAWVKRIGVAGFIFYLIKGLVWLGIFAWAGKCTFD